MGSQAIVRPAWLFPLENMLVTLLSGGDPIDIATIGASTRV